MDRAFATVETRGEHDAKCVPQLSLGSLLSLNNWRRRRRRRLRQRERQKSNRFDKQQTFLCPSLHDYNVKVPKFNSKNIYQHLTRWNKRDKVWGSANSLFRGRFRSRRRRCCLSSPLAIFPVPRDSPRSLCQSYLGLVSSQFFFYCRIVSCLITERCISWDQRQWW